MNRGKSYRLFVVTLFKFLTVVVFFIFQYGHYFNSVQNSSYNTVPKSTVPEVLKNLKGK